MNSENKSHHIQIQILGFSKSGLITHHQVKAFLKALFPKKHLKPISKIAYIDAYKPSLKEQDPIELALTKGINITSTHFVDRNQKIEWIEIYRQDIEGSSDIIFMKECIAHEIGHSVYENLSEEIKSKWEKLSRESNNNELVSFRSAADHIEDFCETYSHYVFNSQKLIDISKDKYQFIKDLF